jgi:hypothetical protein
VCVQFALLQQLRQVRATTMLDGNGEPQCDSPDQMPDRYCHAVQFSLRGVNSLQWQAP